MTTNPSDATVFVTNMNRTHDYASATSHGALRPVTSGNYAIFKTSRLVEEIVEALVASKPTDYLLFSGSSAIAGLCMCIWLEIHGECNALLWSRQDDQYVIRTVKRGELKMLIETTRDRFFGTEARG